MVHSTYIADNFGISNILLAVCWRRQQTDEQYWVWECIITLHSRLPRSLNERTTKKYNEDNNFGYSWPYHHSNNIFKNLTCGEMYCASDWRNWNKLSAATSSNRLIWWNTWFVGILVNMGTTSACNTRWSSHILSRFVKAIDETHTSAWRSTVQYGLRSFLLVPAEVPKSPSTASPAALCVELCCAGWPKAWLMERPEAKRYVWFTTWWKHIK